MKFRLPSKRAGLEKMQRASEVIDGIGYQKIDGFGGSFGTDILEKPFAYHRKNKNHNFECAAGIKML